MTCYQKTLIMQPELMKIGTMYIKNILTPNANTRILELNKLGELAEWLKAPSC